MALAISGIPMLTGDEALAFREKAEETLKKRGSIEIPLIANAIILSPII